MGNAVAGCLRHAARKQGCGRLCRNIPTVLVVREAAEVDEAVWGAVPMLSWQGGGGLRLIHFGGLAEMGREAE